MDENVELKLSLIVVLFLAGVYVVYEAVTIPAGGHPFGHALGILGTILMVMTETLYSARKRLPFFNLGRTRHWLSFHIFTGIVGPALVLVHTGLAFRGFAGLTMFLTVLVVASGFLGRYIYTAVPRTLAGVEVDRRALQAELAEQRAALQAWSAGQSARLQALIQQETDTTLDTADLPLHDVLARRFQEWAGRRRLHRQIRRLEQEEQARLADVELLLQREQRLQRQIRSLQAVRQLMGLWHMAHVPLGLTLFTAVAIHVVATIYYGALAGG
jgi:signal transduction histidine kinase